MQLPDETAKDDMLAAVQGRQAVYEFLAQLFLNPIPTPGRDYAGKMLGAIEDYDCFSDLEDFREGVRRLKSYKAAVGGCDLEAVQRELAVDRTRLCRGVARSDAVIPPYEALYLMPEKETDRLLAVVAFYRKTGLALSGGQSERMDFIGVELAFMAELCAKERGALAAAAANEYQQALVWEREFLREHLLRWVFEYCGRMIEHAQTEFFRGFGYLIRAFLREESELCGAA